MKLGYFQRRDVRDVDRCILSGRIDYLQTCLRASPVGHLSLFVFFFVFFIPQATAEKFPFNTTRICTCRFFFFFLVFHHQTVFFSFFLKPDLFWVGIMRFGFCLARFLDNVTSKNRSRVIVVTVLRLRIRFV